ncbi:Sly41p [Sugiyamaella lignohabitans]|uniref:Sly41p n=1 Tax=Sugiyamaella lignohabitans TaxID=796027 RepID=A0A167C4B5_9ASCO|nr:Sly41p [Sugiyamaella lignohabitans]ANB11196.1 Sly41p [Sugiyamaella lignohabitans]
MSTLSILHVQDFNKTISVDSSQYGETVSRTQTPLQAKWDIVPIRDCNSSVLLSPRAENLPSPSRHNYPPRRTRSQTELVPASSGLAKSVSSPGTSISSPSTPANIGIPQAGYVAIFNLPDPSLTVMAGGGARSATATTSGTGPISGTASQLSSSATFSLRGGGMDPGSSGTRARTNSGPPRPAIIKTTFVDQNNSSNGSDDTSSSPLTLNSASSGTSIGTGFHNVEAVTGSVHGVSGKNPHVRHRDSLSLNGSSAQNFGVMPVTSGTKTATGSAASAGGAYEPGSLTGPVNGSVFSSDSSEETLVAALSPVGAPPGGLSSSFIPNHNNQHLHHIHNQRATSGLLPLAGGNAARRHRSKSFSETVSETSQEAIRQLAPPISLPLVLTCIAWYSTSAMSNTLNKSILTAFPYPVSLSMVQFTLAASFGISTMKLAQISPDIALALPKGIISPGRVGFRPPTKAILMATAPMGMFQLSGHILSHMSTSLIPVSLVHTIKALSPLFTVAAYRLLFGVSYKRSTYLSLIPLTLGVIMTCSVEFSSHFMGLVYALIAALIFVSQNMFSKKLLTSGNTGGDESTKLDKLNVLCYCSSLAFIFTFPLWFFTEGIGLLGDYSRSSGNFFGASSNGVDAGSIMSTSGLMLAFLINGFVHFAQNLLAFQVLGMVSPVTYSVASLIKRIVVITVAIIWFGQRVTGTQGWGILLTFLGLYLYDRCGGDKTKNYEPKSSVLPK